MASSLPNLVNNLSEGIHRSKCKLWYNDKKFETCKIKYKYCFLQYINFNNLIEYKCFCCKKSYQHKFDKKLKEPFFNTCKFSNYDHNKFILLLWKDVYSYEHIDDWEKLMKHLYLKRKIFTVT